MCGINGFVQRTESLTADANEILQRMNGCIVHRGPDDEGFFTENHGLSTVAMAMRRLAVIDLDCGHQPMVSDDSKTVVVFNGEIYNYRQLRHEHLHDIHLKTASDTEVILKLYEKFGAKSFGMFDGMFAFSIYDKKRGKIFIARDFFGEKPLYYRSDAHSFYWCSELKSLRTVFADRPEIDREALNLFFQLTYIPAPYTIYRGYRKLEANRYIELDVADWTYSVHSIRPESPSKKYEGSRAEATATVRRLVEESVVSRSVSDVPIGTFLSGGVDSSVVTSCLARNMATQISTFSVGFAEKTFDESDKSRTVANLLKTRHHEFIISEKDLQADIHSVLTNFDEPFADSSALPTFLVAKKTAEHVTVALTGDGGDEVFGGYNKHLMGRLNTRYTALVPEKLHHFVKTAASPFLTQKRDERGLKFKIRKALNAIDYDSGYYFNIIKLGFQEEELGALLKQEHLEHDVLKYYRQLFPVATTLTAFRMIDKAISLEGDLLVKVDRTSMMSSLECRAPFLNKQLWDFVNTLPENYLIRGTNKKQILKNAFKNEFPPGFLDRSKKGFGIPVGNWLKTILKEELLQYSDEKLLEEQNIFTSQNVLRIVREHLRAEKDHTFRVWTFYCFQKWYYRVLPA